MANYKHTKAELKALRERQHAEREACTQYQNPRQVMTLDQVVALGGLFGRSIDRGARRGDTMSGNELVRLQRERDSLERRIANIDDKVTGWSRERERHAGQLKVVQAKIDVQKRARKASETTTSLHSVTSFHCRMKGNRSACSPDRR